ncbi:hypothetical protein KJ611_01285 [Patescibacteria group bacterium]|nr:hypothetical protein [Patescibacteria group bacterium]MBU1705365.1 hypothetical protein [Patescibacteria group bacterium]
MVNDNVTTNEIMEFLRDNMVTKEELHDELDKLVSKEEFQKELNKLKLDLLDAMDDKLLNLKGDLISIIRKEDHKLIELITVLRKNKGLSDEDVKHLLGLEPFPQTP